MLRFVQGVNKAFRSNQAYAPCQKAAHDPEEYEGVADLPIQQQLIQYGCNAANVPLSIPLPSWRLRAGLNSERFVSVVDDFQEDNHQRGQEIPRAGGFTAGLFPGFLLGAGYTAFQSLHALCSGRRDRDSKYCPVTQLRNFPNNSEVLTGLYQLLPGGNTRLAVLPTTSPPTPTTPTQRKPLTCHIRAETSIAEGSSVDEHDDEKRQRSLALAEYEKAKTKVEILADSLSNIDKEYLATDHFLAMQAWNKRDFSTAANLWSRTVDKFATPMAANRLGECYENGCGVVQDYKQAASYYEKAISHNCSRAMYNLAMLQMKGLVQEKQDSMKLMQRSAQLNNPKAQTFLGSLHFHKGNKELAFKFYEKAARNNDAEGCYYLGVCYETGSGVDISDDVKAAEYYRKAADLGNKDAQYNLAVFYEDGCGDLDKDKQKAIYWLTESSKRGNLQAVGRLSELQAEGDWPVMSSSASLPVIARMQSLYSDLALHTDMTRSRSDNCLKLPTAEKTTILGITRQEGQLSRASSVSSIAAGQPKFFIPAVVDGSDVSDTLDDDWSDQSDVSLDITNNSMHRSKSSMTSLYLERRDDEELSVEFTLDNLSLDSHEDRPSPDSGCDTNTTGNHHTTWPLQQDSHAYLQPRFT